MSESDETLSAAKKQQMIGNYDDLFRLAMKGKLTEEEVAWVVADLEKAEPSGDPHYLISVLCYTTPTLHKQHLVEGYLLGPDDIEAAAAIWTLCSCWDLTDQYMDHLLAFMEGVSWDIDCDCQRYAVACAGTYLKDHTVPELLRKIINLFEDQTEYEGKRGVRESAYRALIRLTGGDPYKQASRRYDEALSFDPSVVMRAKERLAREESKNSSC